MLVSAVCLKQNESQGTLSSFGGGRAILRAVKTSKFPLTRALHPPIFSTHGSKTITCIRRRPGKGLTVYLLGGTLRTQCWDPTILARRSTAHIWDARLRLLTALQGPSDYMANHPTRSQDSPPLVIWWGKRSQDGGKVVGSEVGPR
jgi:hypothetical protein